MPFEGQNADIARDVGASSLRLSRDFTEQLPRISYATTFKRWLDVVLVLVSMPVVLPLIALMAVVVSLDGHSPFYTQLRIGRGGRLFRLLKVRTMVHNADELLQQRLVEDSEVHAEWTATQKLKSDFRITRIGRILRKTSLDELPQLFNVLSGSMSLVGPRPMLPSQRILYPAQAYYRLRPGITGFWQISDRNQCNFCDRAKFDTAYERVVSLRTDLVVLARTVRVVLRGTGY